MTLTTLSTEALIKDPREGRFPNKCCVLSMVPKLQAVHHFVTVIALTFLTSSVSGQTTRNSAFSYLELNVGANHASNIGYQLNLAYFHTWSVHHIGIGAGFIEKTMSNSFPPGYFTNEGLPHQDNVQLLNLNVEYRFGSTGVSPEAYFTAAFVLSKYVGSSHWNLREGGEEVPYDGDVCLKLGLVLRYRRFSISPEYAIPIVAGFPASGDHANFKSPNVIILNLGVRVWESLN